MKWGEYFTGPDLGPLAPLFASRLSTIVSIIWFGCLIFVAVRLMIALAKFFIAKKRGMGDSLGESLHDVIWPTILLIALTLFLSLLLLITSL